MLTGKYEISKSRGPFPPSHGYGSLTYISIHFRNYNFRSGNFVRQIRE